MASRDKSADALEAKDRGNKCLSAGDFDGAIDHYSTAIKLDNTNAVFFSNRSAAYLSKNYHDSALKDAEQAIALRPEWNKGYARKGASLHGANKYDESIAAYEEGLKVCPGDSMIQRGLDQVLDDKAAATSRSMPGAGAGGMGDLSSMFAGLFGPDMFSKLEANDQTSELIKDPNFVQILSMVQSNPSLLNSYLKDPRMMKVLSVLVSSNGAFGGMNAGGDEKHEEVPQPQYSKPSKPAEPKVAEPQVPVNESEEDKEKRLTHDKALVHKLEGNGFYKQRKFDEALAAYEKAIEIEPTEGTFYSNIAAVLLEKKEYEKCIEQSKKACEVAKENMGYEKVGAFIAKACIRMGNAYAKLDKIDEAIESYDKSLMENYSDDANKRQKKMKKLKSEKERKDYLNPEEGLAAKQRGNEFFKAGNWPKAVGEYSDAIKRDPDNAVYYANRAAAYTKLMEFGLGMQDCEKSLMLDPAYVKAWGRKGDIEFLLRKYHRALESYDAGLSIDATNNQCVEGKFRTQNQINECLRSGKSDPERAKRAMEDPEIQALLKDPEVNTVLNEMQNGRNAEANKAMQNPSIAAKISTLVAAGVLGMGA